MNIIEIVGINSAKEIAQFLAINSIYKRDISYWTWMHRLWSSKKSISVIGRRNGKIIAHYAIIIQFVNVNGNQLKIGLGLHALVDRNHRRNISISDVSQVAYQEAKEQGLSFIYGFPNKNYRLVQERLERWHKVALFNAYELTNSHLHVGANEQVKVEKIKKFSIETLFALSKIIENRPSIFVKIEKSIKYFENRYLRHPQNLYDNILLRIDGNVEGFLVLKKYFDSISNETYGHIVDYIISDKISYSSLLNIYLSYYANKVDKFLVWRGNKDFEEVLKNYNFKPQGFDTFFGIKILDKNSISTSEIYQFNDWHLVMGDSDAF